MRRGVAGKFWRNYQTGPEEAREARAVTKLPLFPLPPSPRLLPLLFPVWLRSALAQPNLLLYEQPTKNTHENLLKSRLLNSIAFEFRIINEIERFQETFCHHLIMEMLLQAFFPIICCNSLILVFFQIFLEKRFKNPCNDKSMNQKRINP